MFTASYMQEKRPPVWVVFSFGGPDAAPPIYAVQSIQVLIHLREKG
jgi:hypothetical protein